MLGFENYRKSREKKREILFSRREIYYFKLGLSSVGQSNAPPVIFYRAQQRLRSHEEIGTNSPPRVEGKKEHGLKEFLVFARPSSRPAIGLSGYVQVGHNARTG